ncbi:SAM-dependent methyltransferase [Streptomyces achromogenes]|uniref:class I SAM-dependent methyltransferase n=1 Tax=Streptomyces achromogenes TaxID=67255 RepID=UPI00277EF13D|nr:class I SAM-dependent methyltransferase [Streptomyces achromogenes]MDQ0834519.1 SAM-dependent methyltransferase [Streptomyces achromogenes]
MNPPADHPPTPDPDGEDLLFGPAADGYARFRPGVPEQVAWLLADAVKGVPDVTLLDLGAGTGQVAAALLPALPHITYVDLVDPSRAQLREAAITLHPLLGNRTLSCHEVPADQFNPQRPHYRADLITCCRAFHWMNRPAVLAMANRVAAPHATLALMGDGSLWTHEADWTGALKGLIQSYLGPGRRAGSCGTYTEPSRRYEDDLADSAFRDVSQHLFRFPRAWTPQQVIGYLRTTSFARADLFAERHAEFEAEALHLLEGHADENGRVTEQVDFTVLLARRPGGTA